MTTTAHIHWPGRTCRKPAGGFTLIEVLVAITLMALASVSVMRGIQSVARSDLRNASAHMAGAIRYLFDRASTTGKVHRLVLDMDEGKYWAEVSDDRFFLPRDKETEETRQLEIERIRLEQEDRQKRIDKGLPAELPRTDDESGGVGFGFGRATAGQTYTIDRYLPQPYQRKPPQFKLFKEALVKSVKLGKVRLSSVYTPRMSQAVASGKEYIYFFPLGFAEAAIVHFSDPKREQFFSLVVHPLTGRVQVLDRFVEPPVDKQTDDEGTVIEP